MSIAIEQASFDAAKVILRLFFTSVKCMKLRLRDAHSTPVNQTFDSRIRFSNILSISQACSFLRPLRK